MIPEQLYGQEMAVDEPHFSKTLRDRGRNSCFGCADGSAVLVRDNGDIQCIGHLFRRRRIFERINLCECYAATFLALMPDEEADRPARRLAA